MYAVTGVELVEERSFAGVGSRVGAQLIDSCVSLSTVLFASLILRLLRLSSAWSPRGADARAMWDALDPAAKCAVLLAYIVATGPVYFTLFHSSPWQATLGKRILKIYVTGDDGERINKARSFARWLTFWVVGWFGGSLVSLVTISRPCCLNTLSSCAMALSSSDQNEPAPKRVQPNDR